MKPKNSAASTTVQVEKFGLVGILNTLIDYVIFIALTKIFSIPLSQVGYAKLVSGAVAMANSFYFNRTWVFKSGGDGKSQLVRFLISTLVAVFIIQLGLVQFFSSVFPYFGELGFNIMEAIGIVSLLPVVFTQEFVIKTVAFGLATVASMTWNFLLYKYWAFKG